MNEQPVSVSKISWQELFPWTIIFKTLSIAFSPSVLVWAVLGVVLTPIGWLIGEMLFFDEAMRDSPQLTRLAEINRSPYQAVFGNGTSQMDSVQVLGTNLSGPMLVFEQMVKPFRTLFHSVWSTWEYLYFGFGALWTLLVWAFAGCAITRVAVLRLTRNEVTSIDDGFDFACQKYVDCVLALAMPLAGVAVICIPLAILGLLMKFSIGAFLVSLLWFLVIAGAIAMVVLLLGLMFGWPLIVASVSAEGQNSFDATTRAFAYTMQRPLNYVFYMFVSVLFGGFCWLVVMKSTDAVVGLAYWSTSWGANAFGHDAMTAIQGGEEASGLISTSQKVIGFWNGMARTLASAFIHGLFWCLASAVYLLLRRDVDETELDEVFIPSEQRSYDLPPLKSDEFGVPQVQNPVARTTGDAVNDSSGSHAAE